MHRFLALARLPLIARPALVAPLVAVVAFAPTAAASQGIVTDRPDFVESTSTVGKNNVQVEGSGAFAKTNVSGAEEETFATPFLFRVGVADDWEVRLESEWFVLSTAGTGASAVTTQGMADFEVGVKWAFLPPPESGNMPAMGAVVHARLPSGTADFRGEGIRPSLRVSAEWELANDWGVAVMPGIRLDKAGDARFVSGIFAAVVGKGLTDELSAFAEIAFGQIAGDDRGGNFGFVDFGVTYLLNPRWQLDAAALVGITDPEIDYGFTVGLSGLIPG